MIDPGSWATRAGFAVDNNPAVICRTWIGSWKDSSNLGITIPDPREYFIGDDVRAHLAAFDVHRPVIGGQMRDGSPTSSSPEEIPLFPGAMLG